jgi:hypothetical protein
MHPTWGFVQVGLDNHKTGQVQSPTTVPAGRNTVRL